MTSDDRWRTVERLYYEALERPTSERAAFIEEACGDDASLGLDVRSLLAHDAAASGFLERPAAHDAARSLVAARSDQSAPRIAGYRILTLVGEGGMGSVYLAEQETPLRRRVALKLIRPGMDSPQIVARFEVERQALALMDHPNIAAVYDAGTTNDGRPYVAMEYVDGVPITVYCDRERLSVRARLGLFTRVAAAVQHAHQKGVIHRDLKPTNVLVAEQNGQPVPKVIDFGTAKALASSDISREALTAHGFVLGTLEYMSPEQASLSRDIDTATDVYSLGVLLYELLVGTVPFDRRALDPIDYDEVRRRIRETDPPKPSTRLTADDQAARVVAERRGTDVTLLARRVRGDLDAIVLKALEKDRHRRYPTVAAFSSDVQRFLADEPVDARPPSAAYRMLKFARRYRSAVSAAAVVLFLLVAGLTASTLLYLRAEGARLEADRQRIDAITQRRFADEARAQADVQRAAALRATAEARAANDTAIRQGALAAREASSATAALREAEYREYVAALAAADGELRANLPRAAQLRLLAVPATLRGWEWHHLYLRTDNSLLTLAATPCSPDDRIAGHRRDGTDDLRLDEHGLVAWSRCDRVDRWHPEGYLRNRRAVPDSVRILAADGVGRIAVVSSDSGQAWTLRLLDPDGRRTLATFGPFLAEPACAAISPGGRQVAVGLDPEDSSAGEPQDDVFDVWDVETGQRLTRLQPPRPGLFDTRARFYTSCVVRFSPDGTRLATSGSRVHLWSAGTGDVLHADVTQAGRIAQPITFSPDGSLLAVGRPSGLVDLIGLASDAGTVVHLDGGGLIEPLPMPARERRLLVSARSRDETSALAFAPDGSMIVSAFDTHVALWDLDRRRVVKILEGHQAPVSAVLFSADSRVAYSGDRAGHLRVWPTGASTGITRLPGDSYHARPIVLAADADAVSVAGIDASLSVWRLTEALEIVLRPGSGGILQGASQSRAISPDGRRFFSADFGQAGSVIQWSLDPGAGSRIERTINEVVEPHCRPAPPVTATLVGNLTFSRDGQYLAYSYGTCIGVRDVARGERVASFTFAVASASQSNLQAMAFRSDGALVTITGHWSAPGLISSNLVRVWDWRSGRAELTQPTPAGEIGLRNWQLAFSGDGTRIAMFGGSPAVVSIWDSALRGEIARVVGPEPEPGALDRGDFEWVALNHDGSRLASANRDKAVRVWDATRLQPVLTLTDIDGHNGGVAFTRDGRLVAGRTSGGLTIWESRRPACAACPAGPERD